MTLVAECESIYLTSLYSIPTSTLINKAKEQGDVISLFVLSVVPCAENPCKNGAECTDTDTGAKCKCAFGYIGDTCEEGIEIVITMYVVNSYMNEHWVEGIPALTSLQGFSGGIYKLGNNRLPNPMGGKQNSCIFPVEIMLSEKLSNLNKVQAHYAIRMLLYILIAL